MYFFYVHSILDFSVSQQQFLSHTSHTPVAVGNKQIDFWDNAGPLIWFSASKKLKLHM